MHTEADALHPELLRLRARAAIGARRAGAEWGYCRETPGAEAPDEHAGDDRWVADARTAYQRSEARATSRGLVRRPAPPLPYLSPYRSPYCMPVAPPPPLLHPPPPCRLSQRAASR
jgi:hypothetical protein